MAGCVEKNKQGGPCGAPVMAGTDPPRCFWHAPEAEIERHIARQQGGKNRAAPAPAPKTRLRSVDDVLTQLELTVDRLRAGKEPANVARVVKDCLVAAGRLLEAQDLEKRIRRLEGALGLTEAGDEQIARAG